MKTLIILTFYVILAGILLSGCDYYAGYGICLYPNDSYKPVESNITLKNDLENVTQIVESFATQQGFKESITERKFLHRAYQKNDGNKIYRISISFYADDDMIVVAIYEVQVRKRSKELEKMYIALRKKLEAEFGNDRIMLYEQKQRK